ncbi:MAG: thioredoxin family protein [Planctomycetota bacterium]|nr:thioredoxin family protein [Planctomycetota bacterium]
MLRATYLFLIGVIVTFASLAFAQETDIDRAMEMSRKTGKPIFAIASRKICPPCQKLKSRVSQLLDRSPVRDDIVYLRIDLDEPSWREWSKRFPHQGRMLPIVYMIRADERQLYGRSNTLPGEQLHKFLVQGVAHSGESYSLEEIKNLETANRSIETAIAEGNWELAISSLRSTTNLGKPGQLDSHASAAVRNNQLAKLIGQKSNAYLQSRLASITRELEGDEASQFKAVSQFVLLEQTFGQLEDTADHISRVAVKLAIRKDLRTLWSHARQLQDASDRLVNASDREGIEKAIQTLDTLEASDVPEIVKTASRKVRSRNRAIVASLRVPSTK